MKEAIPRISVLVITYKQEELIKRSLDSLLAQVDYIYEICVSDDCSPDGTWDVLLDYDKKYPGLFKLNQNKTNIGIFENFELTWSMPTGDVIYMLAGDDQCGENWFKTVVDYIQNNNIDYKNELFCIYGNYKCIYPNKDSLVHSNSASEKKINRLRLYERGYLSNRSCCYSINVLKKFKKVSMGKSYIVENALDSQLHIFSNQAYYIPHVGNIYYTRIGVSANMSSKTISEYENTMVYAFEFLISLGIQIHPRDKRLPQYNIAMKRFKRQKSFGNFSRLVKCYINQFDLNFVFLSKVKKNITFSIARRLPHANPINW